MRVCVAVPLLLLSSVVACGRTPAPRSASGAAAGAAAPTQAKLDIAASPPLLGWVVVDRLDAMLAPFPDVTKAQLLAAFGLGEQIAQAVDGKRPLAAAIVDVRTPGVFPLVAALPFTNQPALLAALGSVGTQVVVPGAKGMRAWQLANGGRLYAKLVGNVAYFAFSADLANRGQALLTPAMTSPRRGPITARALLPALRRGYGNELNVLIGGFLAMTTPGGVAEPRVAYELRHLRQAVSQLPSAQAVEVVLDPQPDALKVTVRLEGAPGGDLGRYVSAQRHGTTWGADLVPAEAMLFYGTHADPAGQRSEAQAFATYLASLPSAQAKEGHWRSATTRAAAALTGDWMFAVWPASGGGVGLGGAYGIAGGAGDTARKHFREAYGALAPVLGAAMVAELGMDPKKVRFRVASRRGEPIEGVAVDLVQFTPVFSADTAKERKVVRWLLGETPTLAIAIADDRVIWTAGRDYRPRLATMMRAARGEPVPSISANPSFAAASHSDQPRVTFAWVSTAAIAGFVADALAGTNSLADGHRAALGPFLKSGDAGALTVTTQVFPGGKQPAYEIACRVPAAALLTLNGVGGAMWRLGLGLVMGPPPPVPIPSPPRAVTPPVREPPADQQQMTPSDLPTGRGT